MAEFATKGVAGTGLGLGIAGTALGLLQNGTLGGILGGGCCGEDHNVSRYELGLEKEVAAKDSEIGMLKSTIHTDGKFLELYQYVDGRLRGIESQIGQQAVVNAQVAANLSCMQGNIATLMGLVKTVVPIDNICPTPAVATATT